MFSYFPFTLKTPADPAFFLSRKHFQPVLHYAVVYNGITGYRTCFGGIRTHAARKGHNRQAVYWRSTEIQRATLLRHTDELVCEVFLNAWIRACRLLNAALGDISQPSGALVLSARFRQWSTEVNAESGSPHTTAWTVTTHTDKLVIPTGRDHPS